MAEIERPPPGKWMFDHYANKLVQSGIGWEDLFVKMRPYGMSEQKARLKVFGNENWKRSMRNRKERLEKAADAANAARLLELMEEFDKEPA
jgi:hypothetical protein